VVGFITGIPARRFLLLNRNMGEALMATTLARLGCPHVLIKNVTLKPRMLWSGSR